MFNKKDDKPKEPLTKDPASAEGFGEAKEENKNIGTPDLSAEVQKTKADDKEIKKIEELEKQKKEYLEGWKRERADFLNYKKDEMERIVGLMKYANEEFVLRVLPILDNFFVAEKHISEEEKKNEIIRGLLLIHKQIKDFLKTQGVEEIKAAGEMFNPNFMEVVGEANLENQESGIKNQESGIVVEEIQKGYTMNGKVIRPARVKISK